jgi:hypothetical protein
MDQAFLKYCAVGHLDLPDPIYWLRKRLRDQIPVINDGFHTAITHGDAWAENLFVTKLGTAIWIDFERTGEGYVLQDFARLEFDVLTRLLKIEDDATDGWRVIFDLYRAVVQIDNFRQNIDLLSPNPEIRKAIQVIVKIRQEAVRYAQGVIDTRQYLIALLVNSVFRSTLEIPHASAASDEEMRLRQDKALMTWRLEQQRAMLLGALIADKFDSYSNATWPRQNWNGSVTEEILRKAFTHHPWTVETIQQLMFDVLGKTYDDFAGDTLKAKIRSFYRVCEESGELVTLLSAILKLFPNFPKGFNLG